MSGRRVVVTGIGLTSPIGNDLPTAVAALREGRHGIVTMPCRPSRSAAVALRRSFPIGEVRPMPVTTTRLPLELALTPALRRW